MDRLTPAQRRRAMVGNVSSGTAPERALLSTVEAMLRGRGLAVIGNDRVFGVRVDVSVRSEGAGPLVAIFMHGCFWHVCPKHHRQVSEDCPRKAYWDEKWRGNRSRDRRVAAHLRSYGLMVLTVWEHDVRAGRLGRVRAALARRLG